MDCFWYGAYCAISHVWPSKRFLPQTEHSRRHLHSPRPIASSQRRRSERQFERQCSPMVEPRARRGWCSVKSTVPTASLIDFSSLSPRRDWRHTYLLKTEAPESSACKDAPYTISSSCLIPIPQKRPGTDEQAILRLRCYTFGDIDSSLSDKYYSSSTPS